VHLLSFFCIFFDSFLLTASVAVSLPSTSLVPHLLPRLSCPVRCTVSCARSLVVPVISHCAHVPHLSLHLSCSRAPFLSPSLMRCLSCSHAPFLIPSLMRHLSCPMRCAVSHACSLVAPVISHWCRCIVFIYICTYTC